MWTSFGAVACEYKIGKYEVTNAQYCEFLNAVAKRDKYGLYNIAMAGEYGGITQRGSSGNYSYAVKTGMGNKPVNFVSWYDVGSYTRSASPYGTFDQNDNMWEWNETQGGGNCGVRGGSFYINDHEGYLRSSARWVSNPPTFEFSNYGFRVVALGAPES